MSDPLIPPPCDPGNRVVVTRWFIRCIGLVHVFNFWSLAEQVSRTLGSRGLLPVREYVQRFTSNPDLGAWDRILACPSLFLWSTGDALLVGLAWVGVGLGVLTVLGILSRWCFMSMFILYLSYVSVGQMLYQFQWDSLILETTVLCFFLPSSGVLFRKWGRGADKVVAWLFLWLLYRLYFESGLAKLFWGPDTWATLDAMRRYYETAPIPTILGWYAHDFSAAWHQFETAATLVIELLLPAVIFASPGPRRFGLVVFTGFQIAILLTANYGIFNYTTLCLHLFLLTDQDVAAAIHRIPPLARRFSPPLSSTPARPRLWMVPIAAVLVICSVIEFVMLAGGQGVQQTRLPKIERYISQFHISSRYHLFGPIDPIRYELSFEGSVDGQNWVEYEFPYKAGPLDRPPPFVAPFHPRVDFRLWFERYPLRWQSGQSMPYPDASAAPGALPTYLGKLASQLLESPPLALRHFVRDPLDGKPPVEVRITFYHYQMTRRSAIPSGSRTVYWERTNVGVLYIDPTLGKNGLPTAVPQRTSALRRARGGT